MPERAAVKPAATGRRFIERALEDAGIPVLPIEADVVDAGVAAADARVPGVVRPLRVRGQEPFAIRDRIQAGDRLLLADDAAVDVVVRPVAADTVAVMTVGEGVGQAFHELESYVRDRGRRAHRPPGAFPEAREIFVPITGPIDETDRIGVRRLPACRVASVIHRGDYGGVAPARQRLMQWVAAAGLTPDGPMRTLYLQFGAEPDLQLPPGWVVERDADFVTELQLPVG